MSGMVIIIRGRDGKETVIPVNSRVEIVIQQNVEPAKGWDGWPKDAPRPAKAPFDAAQAKKHQEEWAAYLKVPVEFENSLGMKFRLIPPGEFTMGGTPDEIKLMHDVCDRWEANNELNEIFRRRVRNEANSEGPQHRVAITKAFYLGLHEVTQRQYQQVKGKKPSHFRPGGKGGNEVKELTNEEIDQLPVENVVWNDATSFCERMSESEVTQKNGPALNSLHRIAYRLPTEAEWEMACRAGTTTIYFTGDDPFSLDGHAHFSFRTGPVGNNTANSFGIFDLHSNVQEWCQDVWSSKAYTERAQQPLTIDPVMEKKFASGHVQRGGNFGSDRLWSRSAYRNEEGLPCDRAGFRVAVSVESVRQALAEPAPKTPATKAR